MNSEWVKEIMSTWVERVDDTTLTWLSLIVADRLAELGKSVPPLVVWYSISTMGPDSLDNLDTKIAKRRAQLRGERGAMNNQELPI